MLLLFFDVNKFIIHEVNKLLILLSGYVIVEFITGLGLFPECLIYINSVTMCKSIFNAVIYQVTVTLFDW